jgi:thiol-disulfide isomerase/thioredoxin
MRIAVALTLLASIGTARAEDCEKKVGDRMPEVKGTDQNDKAATTKGKGWVFVTVGASWCDPCKKELPAWDKLAPDFAGKITWVAVDIDEKVADGKKFHDELKLKNLQRLYTKESSIGNLGSVMPSSYVVDPKGVIRYERCGFEKQGVDGEISDMRAQLAKLLK